jgi:hypothetical protein
LTAVINRNSFPFIKSASPTGSKKIFRKRAGLPALFPFGAMLSIPFFQQASHHFKVGFPLICISDLTSARSPC